jgi:hypothetical protein
MLKPILLTYSTFSILRIRSLYEHSGTGLYVPLTPLRLSMTKGKLTEEQVCQVPELMLDRTVSAIARHFGVTPAAIRNVIQEERWKRYSDELPGKPDRCPDCGALVLDDTQPCLACSLRRC